MTHPDHSPAGFTTKTVAAAYRSNEEIGELLAQVAAQPAPPDELTRSRVLDVLDDLAEAMIGRHRPADLALKARIQQHCDQLRP